MSAASRRYILTRRAGGISDMSGLTLENGDVTIDEAEIAGMYKVNCRHQIGIATATEVGLALDKFPIRVIIGNAERAVQTVDTCVSYWVVCNNANAPLAFQRRPLATDMLIKNLYRYVSDFDLQMWDNWESIRDKEPLIDFDQGLDAKEEELCNILALPDPTDEQKRQFLTVYNSLVVSFKDANRVPYFKISNDYYIKAVPHGIPFTPVGDASANRVALNEVALTTMVNSARLRARHTSLTDGAITTAAYSIATMFRYGLFESYEHKEFVTIRVSPVANTKDQFAITHTYLPDGYTLSPDLAVGQVLNVGSLKLYKKMSEYSSLLVWVSGLMHYLFNHTTGGARMTGSLLTTLSMYKLVSGDINDDDIESLTSCFYEALHPSNKRAIANIFFPSSQVTTHGRMTGSPRYEKFNLDSFAAIRGNPYPAGSHKAFVCVSALKRVLQAGLGPFLPWAGQLSDCANVCKEILGNGARAHIGSNYYTGQSAVTQPSSLDQYLPELAYYVQTFNRGDTLAMSPHLAPEIANRSNMNWMNMLKDLKAKDVSATSVEVVRQFLTTQGAVHFDFDPADQTTWGHAARQSETALAAIMEVFK